MNTLRPAAAIDEGTYRSFSILQEAQPDYPTLRSHRLAVGLYDDAGKLMRRRRVELDVVGRETEVPELAGEALAALTLLNDGDLTYAKIRLDDASFATLTRRLKDLPDSLPRALCWAATWDMVRDAELPTRDYVRLVLGNVDATTPPWSAWPVLPGSISGRRHRAATTSSPGRGPSPGSPAAPSTSPPSGACSMRP